MDKKTQWTVWVEGVPMNLDTEPSTQEEILEFAQTRFHPQPSLFFKGDKHPLDIKVTPGHSSEE